MSEHPEKSGRQAGGELVIPIMAIAFSIYFFSTILESPWTAQVSAFMIGGILIALCLGFIVKTVLAVSGGSASFGFGKLLRRDDWRSGRIGLLAATVGYVLLIDWGGFTLTTFLFLSASMAILSRGRRLDLITLISAAMALGGWALFILAFDTRFPRGWFEEAMAMVLANG